jgi:transposase-like protein
VIIYTHFEKKKEQEDKQREVAMAEGTIQDVANYYGVDPKSVRAWRKKYRQI